MFIYIYVYIYIYIYIYIPGLTTHPFSCLRERAHNSSRKPLFCFGGREPVACFSCFIRTRGAQSTNRKVFGSRSHCEKTLRKRVHPARCGQTAARLCRVGTQTGADQKKSGGPDANRCGPPRTALLRGTPRPGGAPPRNSQPLAKSGPHVWVQAQRVAGPRKRHLQVAAASGCPELAPLVEEGRWETARDRPRLGANVSSSLPRARDESARGMPVLCDTGTGGRK